MSTNDTLTRDQVGNFLVGFALGVAGGVIGATLLTPRSGTDLRDSMQTGVRDVIDELRRDWLEEDLIPATGTKSQLKYWLRKLQVLLESQVDRASRDRAAERLSRAKEREVMSDNYFSTN